MYVRSVKVKNFGTIKSTEQTFSSGLNIIRGSNEVGKSTLVEAILYGMFGSSSLRGTVEETVRDGCKASDLRVELEYGEYRVKRTKSSASVVGTDTKINGQANVSNFFYSLLGISKGNETSVLISEQGKTAGILDGKPGDVSSLIEGLAGFDHIDSLIESVKEKFPSGNQKLLEEMLEEAKIKLLEKKAIVIESPDTLKKEVEEVMVEVSDGKLELSDLRDSISNRERELAEAEANSRIKEKLHEDIKDLETEIDKLKRSIEAAKEVSGGTAPNVESDETFVNDYAKAVEQWELYKKVTSFEWNDEEWEGDITNLLAEIDFLRCSIDEDRSNLSDLKAEVKVEKRKVNNEDTCSSCGQGIAHLHEEINKKAEIKIEELESRIANIIPGLEEQEGTLKILRRINAEQKNRDEYKKYAIDVNVLPWSLSWDCGVPGQPSAKSFNEAQERIKRAERIERSIKKASEDVVDYVERKEELTKKLETAVSKYNGMFLQDSSDLKEIVTSLKKTEEKLSEKIDSMAVSNTARQREIDRLENAAEALMNEITKATEECDNLKEKIEKDSYNYTVLRAVRKAKPLVLNEVWKSVLASVSSTFSEMRGYESVVTKTEKGFAVDELPVHRLSGSAKSILGIAVRSSLRDIFAPSAGFMSLDEPSSDCDEERTASVVAAIASIRGQVLVITHEDISDGSADNIIDLTN